MEFRTVINTKGISGKLLMHDSKVLMLGSCFSDNMGQRLAKGMVNVMVNPFGTTYNPFSIARCVKQMIKAEQVPADELFLSNGVWNSFLFHSRFSGADMQSTLDAMNASIIAGHEHLLRCSHVFITLGTAYTYSLADCGMVVNNCHKQPASIFLRRLRRIDETCAALEETVEALHEFNSDASIVLTVSPIRHLADGLEMSQLSKSTLLVAAHDTVSRHADYCSYFPSYEIMMDDLRDYRFYASDMTHPSDVAVDYIWEKFKDAFFDNKERAKVDECERFSRRLSHRVMSGNPEVAERFRLDTRNALVSLVERYPHIKEIESIKQILN